MQLQKHKKVCEEIKTNIMRELVTSNIQEPDFDDSDYYSEFDEPTQSYEGNKGMIVFINNLALFPPLRYPYTVTGYPEYVVGRCPCSKFYRRRHSVTYKASNTPVPNELSEDRKACNKVFSVRGLYQYLQSMKSCKYHEAIYELVKGLYCDSNGDLRIVFKDYVGNMIDLHHDGKYVTPTKKHVKRKKDGKQRNTCYN